MSRPNSATLRALCLAAASAVLLILSFPNFNQWWCAWIALVPWLVLLRARTPRAAFWWSFHIGIVFFLASLWWLTYVTIIGWMVLCAILAVFFGIFGWLVALLGSARSDASGGSSLVTSGFSLVLVPALWVSTEFLRSYIFSGFGWNALSYSQTPWPAVIQCADATGAWGVSFLIVLVNGALAGLFHPASSKSPALRRLLVAGALVAAAVAYGAWRIPRVAGRSTVRVAVVQGSIPQDQKWDAAYQARIFERYTALTKAAAATGPDLIVWPETSVPGYFGVDEDVTQWVLGLAREVHRPLLVGAPIPTIQDVRVALTNAAALVDADGDIKARYAKTHLVPFGEYVPLDQALPWLRAILPAIGTFTPGNEFTVFHLGSGLRAEGSGQAHSPQPPPQNVGGPAADPPGSVTGTAHSPELNFSVLICFEDLFPSLARRFVQRGARMLFVITNDAWFGPTAAAYQHAQASSFRAIELRVPIARAGNTGWSGCIDATGRWLNTVHDASGRELFIPGTQTCDVTLSDAPRSLYLRWGDWFPGLCLLLTLGWLGLHLLLGRRELKSE